MGFKSENKEIEEDKILGFNHEQVFKDIKQFQIIMRFGLKI